MKGPNNCPEIKLLGRPWFGLVEDAFTFLWSTPIRFQPDNRKTHHREVLRELHLAWHENVITVNHHSEVLRHRRMLHSHGQALEVSFATKVGLWKCELKDLPWFRDSDFKISTITWIEIFQHIHFIFSFNNVFRNGLWDLKSDLFPARINQFH